MSSKRPGAAAGRRQPAVQVEDDDEYYSDEETVPAMRQAPPPPARRREAPPADPSRSQKTVKSKKSSEDGAAGGTAIAVSSCSDKLVSEMIKGNYVKQTENHGRPVFVKEGGKVAVFIYYWDDRDGPESNGWWFGHKVGGDQVWAYAKQHGITPPGRGWNVPHDGDADNKLKLTISGGAAPEKPAKANPAKAARRIADPDPEDDPRRTMPGAAEARKVGAEPQRKRRREAVAEADDVEEPLPRKTEAKLRSRGDAAKARNTSIKEDADDTRKKLAEKRRREEEEEAEEARVLEEKQARMREKEAKKKEEMKRREEEARQRAEEEARQRRQEDKERLKREEEEKVRRREREEAARKTREEDARRRQEEEDLRRQQEAAKRAKEEALREKENAAADPVRAALRKLRMVNPGSLKQLVLDTEATLKRQYEEMGSMAKKMEREVKEAVRDSESRCAEIVEQRAREERALIEKERKQKEDAERMKKFGVFLKDILEDTREAEDDAEAADEDSKKALDEGKDQKPEEIVPSFSKVLKGNEKGMDLAAKTLAELKEGFKNMSDVEDAKRWKGEVDSLSDRLLDAHRVFAKVKELLESTLDKATRKTLANKRKAKREAEFEAANRSGGGKLSREDVAYFSAEQYEFKLPDEILDAIMANLEPITVDKFQPMRYKVSIAKSESVARAKRVVDAEKKQADAVNRKSMRDESDSDEKPAFKSDAPVRGRGVARWGGMASDRER